MVEKKIQSFLIAKLPFYLKILKKMVLINSYTGNPEGVNGLGQFTAAQFAALGFQADIAQAASQNYGDHRFLLRPGGTRETIAFVSHLDTVFPPEEELQQNFRWREEGDRIFGPGIVDIKGGTILAHMVLAALQDAVPEFFDAVSWAVLLNAREEELSKDFSELCLDYLHSDVRACLVVEEGKRRDEEFVLVRARKGRVVFRIRTEGRGAHSGSSHKEGINAILQLSYLIDWLSALTDYKRGLTVNVGTISGGTVVNRVPDSAEATVEIRAHSLAVFEKTALSILALESKAADLGVDPRCKISVEVTSRIEPWPQNEATDRLVAVWQEAGKRIGIRVITEERGGGSDGNYFWQHVPTLDGLGPAGGNPHCSRSDPTTGEEQEYLTISSLIPKATLNALAIIQLMRPELLV